MEITKREIIVSLAIIAVMLIFGFIIGDQIQDAQNDKNAQYYKALQIDNNTELFQYGMDTNVGNAFIYGNLKAIDTVTFDEIGGEYMWVKKEEEHYNMHTRTVPYTDSNGKTQTRTETYWSWDYHDSWSKHCDKISFCGVEFNYGKIKTPSSGYIKTINKSSHVRFKYYGVPADNDGTVYTMLSDGTITDHSVFYNNKSIDETLEHCTTNFAIVFFWIFWVLLSGAAVAGFYYLDNWWLED